MPLSKIPSAGFQDNVKFRNIIINGDMSIAQRSTSVAGITGAGYNTIDRMRLNGGSFGTWTQSQSTDVPSGQGFAKSLKMDCTTANSSLSASSHMFLNTRIEGQNLQYLKKGTSSAESLTLSFWVKSNKTGTYICELRDQDNSRQINKSYTINSANTWEKKIITFEGDTTGAFDNDNAESIRFSFWLVAGTDYNSGTLGTSWQTINNPDRAVGQVNLADSTSNEWYITGVQLEAGQTASEFEFLPRDISLQRCYRYCYKTPTGSLSDNAGEYCNAHHYASNLILGHCSVNPVEMRAVMSVSFSGSFESYGASAVYAFNSINAYEHTSRGFQINGTPATNRTPGQAVTIRNANNTTAYMLLTAEL